MAEQNHTQYWKIEYRSLENKFDELTKLSKTFVHVDDEIHSAPEDEDWKIVEERGRRYTEARKELLLFMKRT